MSIENGCYYCKSCDICDNKDCRVNKQKEEIERLTEVKNEYSVGYIDGYGQARMEDYYEYAELRKQADELTVKVKSFEITDLCKEAYIEQLKEENKELVSAKVFELETENTNLQKQVDELIKQLNDMEEQRDRQAYITEDLIQEKHRWTEQAIKDKAKEIFTKVKAILNYLDNEWEISNALYPLEKEYAVEVE